VWRVESRPIRVVDQATCWLAHGQAPDWGAIKVRTVAGVLRDGTPYFAPIGQVVADGALVTCHLCGRAFRSAAAPLSSHAWTNAQYWEAFGLERRQSLEGADTRKLRAAIFSARLAFEPALRNGRDRGHELARSGSLNRQAAGGHAASACD
jgi:hypothetical protein